ncbi:oligosaccharide flippase family protein [Microbacterium testaceum]|uniref:oligosaccharide flippase family protein n=1 Tax=Microbacterium testaceum TaxID=2033 RepID=UPI002AC6C70C|nr:oligosaccharide flippase family protein [Microbacterium testaceum]MDZ5146130.1 oligosaccharide flippase family protein [Microbacterium testaceum]
MTRLVEAPTGRRGAATLLGAQWGRYVLQVGGIVLLARLVAPDEFGLVALGAALAGLAAVLGDFGLSLAALREQSLSSAQRDNLFWINTLVGVIGTAVVLALSSPLAAIYGDPRLATVLVLLAPAFALRAASVQFRVELNRSHRLERLAVSEFVGDALGLGVAAASAVLGAGYVGLAVQGSIAALMTLVLSVAMTPWFPRPPHQRAGMKGLLSFGGNTFVTHVLNYASTNIGTVAIAQHFSNQVVGIFGRANQLVNLPIEQLASPLTRIVIPRLTAASGADELERQLRRLQTVLCYPILAYISLFIAVADPAIVIVLGPAWEGAADFVPVLAVGGTFQILGYVGFWGFVVRGRSGALLFSEASGRILMIALALLLVPLGPLWVATSLAAGQALIWLSATAFFLPRAGLNGWALSAPGVRPVLTFGAAAVIGWLAVDMWAPTADAAIRLLIGAGMWAGTAVLLTALWGRPDVLVLRNFLGRK